MTLTKNFSVISNDAGSLGIFTPLEIVLVTPFHVWRSTKTTLVFLPNDGEASYMVSLLSYSIMQPENTYSCFPKLTGRVWVSQKKLSINTDHRYCQHSSLFVRFIWSIDSDSVLTSPIRKDGMQGWLVDDKISTPEGIFVVTPSWEWWSSKNKEATFPHEVRLTQLDTNPVFQCFWGNSFSNFLTLFKTLSPYVFLMTFSYTLTSQETWNCF